MTVHYRSDRFGLILLYDSGLCPEYRKMSLSDYAVCDSCAADEDGRCTDCFNKIAISKHN